MCHYFLTLYRIKQIISYLRFSHKHAFDKYTFYCECFLTNMYTVKERRKKKKKNGLDQSHLVIIIKSSNSLDSLHGGAKEGQEV